jgi:cell division septal protein FtsQ
MKWFKRVPRNRRLDRRQVLEVKLRSSQIRSQRIRLAVSIGITLMSLIVLGFSFWRGGGWLLDRALFRSDAFALRHLDVQTEGMIAPDQVRQWAGVRPGDNLWRLDLARVRRELQLVPFIESVAVVRVPPHTLRIRITERTPIAQAGVHRFSPDGAAAASVRYYLDASGHVMPPLESWQGLAVNHQWFEGLPMLLGMPPSDLRPGIRAESPKVLAALRLLTELQLSPMVGLADIERIDLSGVGVLQARTSQGLDITLGLDRFEEQLRRWRAIHDYATHLGRVTASLDLSISNNIPARWLEASAAPPPGPKTPSTLRPRKRNV